MRESGVRFRGPFADELQINHPEMLVKRFVPFLFVLAVGLSGCADKLKYDQSFSLVQSGESEKLLSPPMQSSAQTIKVQVTANEPVDVYIFLNKDVAQPLDLKAADRAAKATSSKVGVTTDTLSVSIPAKTEYSVLIALSSKTKKAEVTVKLTN